jgi:hypothetical protein
MLYFADCASYNPYNENQPDALFILNVFIRTTSTCFGRIYCPSSGGIHYICTAIGTCNFLIWR